jgi:hypothetical protein
MKSAPDEPPPLTDSEMDLAFREGATDEEIAELLRDLFFWSYIIREPLGKVCTVGRGARDDCIREGFALADKHAAEELPSHAMTPENEIRALNGPWRLVLWPPKIDRDPRAWIGDLGLFDDDEG